MKYLYIMISKTETGVGRLLRRFGDLNYNHVSLSLDEELTSLYSFARSERYGFLTGSIVHETTDRYLAGSQEDVQIEIFRIPVSDQAYQEVCELVHEVLNDKEYMYNLISVVAYPLFKGFSTYKAYSCMEFVLAMLEPTKVMDLEEPLYSYRPDDLETMLKEYVHYKGNLLEYVPDETFSEDYFRPITLNLIRRSLIALAIISYRSVRGIKKKWRESA